MTTAWALSRLLVFERSGGHWTREYGRFALVNVVAAAQVWLIAEGLARWVFPAIGMGFHPQDVVHAIGVGRPRVHELPWTQALQFRTVGPHHGRSAISGRPSDAGRPTRCCQRAYVLDEEWYCHLYTDVQQAVAQGSFISAAHHYAQFGRDEAGFPAPRRRRIAAWAAAAMPGPRWERLRMPSGRPRWAGCGPRDSEQAPGWYWMAHPMVRERLNRLASGDPRLDAYDRLVQMLRERGVALPIGRAVSLGCGFGGLERDLASRGIIREIDAYDIAPGAIGRGAAPGAGGRFHRVALPCRRSGDRGDRGRRDGRGSHINPSITSSGWTNCSSRYLPC